MNKKGVIGLSTFSLLVLLFLITFLFTYVFVQDTKAEGLKLIGEKEATYSALSLRSSLLNLLSEENTTLTYRNEFDVDNMKLTLSGSRITAFQQDEEILVNISFSNLGIPFCSIYEISPKFETTFEFNGSCISVTS